MKSIENRKITPEFLLANGFLELINSEDYPHVSSDLPDYFQDERLFYEADFHRNLITIVFDRDMDCRVLVQIDVGCGTTEMPFRWVNITPKILNHLYFAFMDKPLFVL